MVSATPKATLDDLADLLANWNVEYTSCVGSTPPMSTPVKSRDSVPIPKGQEEGEGDGARSAHESHDVARFLAELAPHEYVEVPLDLLSCHAASVYSTKAIDSIEYVCVVTSLKPHRIVVQCKSSVESRDSVATTTCEALLWIQSDGGCDDVAQ